MRGFFIKTGRIGFGVWEEHDLDNAIKLWGDSAVARYISAGGIFSLDEIQRRLNQEIENQALFNIQYWPLFHLESGEIAGCCGFRPYKAGGVEFGVHIRSCFWRQGIALEAGEKALDYCMQIIMPRLIAAGHNPENHASKALLEKLGFIYSHDEYYEPTGLMHPTYFYKHR